MELTTQTTDTPIETPEAQFKQLLASFQEESNRLLNSMVQTFNSFFGNATPQTEDPQPVPVVTSTTLEGERAEESEVYNNFTQDLPTITENVSREEESNVDTIDEPTSEPITEEATPNPVFEETDNTTSVPANIPDELANPVQQLQKYVQELKTKVEILEEIQQEIHRAFSNIKSQVSQF